MKIGLYSPYVPKHIGGGEKYFFDVATSLRDLGHQVFILLSPDSYDQSTLIDQIRFKYENFLGISLIGIEFIKSPLGKSGNFFKKLYYTAQFDLLYLITDGSLFFSSARKNIVHFQIPFTQPKTKVLDLLKLKNWSIKNANSQFTQQVVEQSWKIKIPFVHYPMVELPQANFHSSEKEKIILNVGRFFDHLHSKRQDILIKAFLELRHRYPKAMSDWKLILIGPAEDPNYAAQIAKLAIGHPIEILHQVSRQELLSYYNRATFYWHAAGFEVDEKNHPEKVEHFGISTVEAMNYGCLPLVVGKGGQVEVLGETLHDYLWQTTTELVESTHELIGNPKLRVEIAELAVTQAKKFDQDHFVKTLEAMVS